METRPGSLSLLQSASAKGEDPWDGLVQSGCATPQGAGSIRPLVFSGKTPRQYYRFLRTLWADENLAPTPEFLRHPFAQTFAPAAALAFLLGKKEPLCPDSEARGPTVDLCQLALLWLIAGEEEAARRLILRLLPLIRFPSFSCPEEDYDEDEWLLSFSLLFRAIGESQKAAEFLSRAKKPVDLFFIALAKRTPRIAVPFDAPLSPKKGIVSAFGSDLSLGVLRAGEVEIRAFGPQPLPLKGIAGFGIFSDGSPEEWMCCRADPEIWLQMKTRVSAEACQIDLRFVGLKPQAPMAVVFYVKASHCQVGGQNLKPKTLHRYLGEAKSLVLGGNVKMEIPLSPKVEVIPLAGEGCFWNADFLIATEIHPFTGSASFRFEN